ncbi:mucin-3A [Bacillus rossius redtenbacheri]|uniref:mucin-3A n=1 Tax=Bacillus rossius redtenbacheri TaxID=93214 RepID=UPI002FDCDD8B
MAICTATTNSLPQEVAEGTSQADMYCRVVVLLLGATAILSGGQRASARQGGYRWEPFNPQLPIDAMTEVVGQFAVDVLQDHAFSQGNFAFSPYGATSVLIALYEGARGESARQIHDALRLPWNHDVLRIGFRDLHRKLRVHFVHEGFLNGLTFSKNTTDFRPEYLRALRFYGYEMKPVNRVNESSLTTQRPETTISPTEPDESISEPEVPSTTLPMTSDSGQTSLGDGTTEVPLETTTYRENFTEKNPESRTSETSSATVTEEAVGTESQILNSHTTNSLSTEDKLVTSELTVTTEVQRNTEMSYESSQITDTTSSLNGKTTQKSSTEATVSEVISEQTTIISELSTTEPYSPTTEESQNVSDQPSTTRISEVNATDEITETLGTTTPEYTSTSKENAQSSPTIGPSETVTPNSLPTTTDIITDTSVLSSSTEQVSTSEISAESTMTTSEKELIPTTENSQPESTSGDDSITSNTVTEVSSSTIELTTESTPTLTSVNEAPETTTSPAETSTNAEGTVSYSSTITAGTRERNARSISTTDSETGRGDLLSGNQRFPNKMMTEMTGIGGGKGFSLTLQDELLGARQRGLAGSAGEAGKASRSRLLFLADGAVEERVPAMAFAAVLPFAYVPRLDALALELPLENKWHRLVILMPLGLRGLQELIYDLSSYPLGRVLRSLHRTRVSAIIPNIMVQGMVELTQTLRKMGICNVFDPRRADLSSMSRDPELYVTDLDQSIVVDISSDPGPEEPQTRAKSGRRRVEHFVANHPFLYFVVDRDTRVPLVAGQMVDPLNPRIH